MPQSLKAMNCVVIAPPGRVLDCMAAEVVFPSHDGLVGILPGHMPMFCQLGLGIMKVVQFGPGVGALHEDTWLLIDGGFAMIHSDLVTLLADDAVNMRQTSVESIETILERSKKMIAAGRIGGRQLEHDLKRNSLLEQLALRCGMDLQLRL